MPPQTKRSNDFPGRQAAQLASDAAEQRKQVAEQMAMITATEKQEFEDTVYDMTERPDQPTIVDEVIEVGVGLADGSVVVRVAEDVENMTYGYRNNYSFKAGGKYKVPRGVADRLGMLGLLYERL